MDSVLGLVRHPGNDGLLRAIEMSLVSTLNGQPFHVHAEGLRGTGKTTLMRAARRVLPQIRRVRGCLYNCEPGRPHCPQHRDLSVAEVEALGAEWVPMPFLEISHSAKVGTVVGSIDLGRLVDPSRPAAALLPGTIPQAHRGLIFIDEINRLAETAPDLADILLDVMGTKPGRVQIEETGLPAVELGVQVTVWAASNPDEDPGPLEEVRRQLSDRFDLAVYSDRPGDAAVVERIMAAGEQGLWAPPTAQADEQQAQAFRSRLAGRGTDLRRIEMPQALRLQVAELYSRFNLESLRAVQALQLGMRLCACLEGRTEATNDDLARVVPVALRHRVDPETMKKITAHVSGMNTRSEAPAAGVAAVPPVRPRFPNISFGGAAVQPLAEPHTASAPTAQPADRPVQHASALPSAALPSAALPSAALPTAAPSSAAPSQAEGVRPGWLGRTWREVRRNLGLESPQPMPRPELRRAPDRRLTAPRPGRLFQEAGLGSAAPPRLSDPLANPPQAPPTAARPISALDAAELIRTEEELNRR